MTDDALTLASKRYRALVEHIGMELEHRHGWRSEAARQLGVSASYVSKVLSGQPFTIGSKAIEAAVANLGVNRDYFFDESVPAGPVPAGMPAHYVLPPHESEARRKSELPLRREWSRIYDLARTVEDATRAGDKAEAANVGRVLAAQIRQVEVFAAAEAIAQAIAQEVDEEQLAMLAVVLALPAQQLAALVLSTEPVTPSKLHGGEEDS